MRSFLVFVFAVSSLYAQSSQRYHTPDQAVNEVKAVYADTTGRHTISRIDMVLVVKTNTGVTPLAPVTRQDERALTVIARVLKNSKGLRPAEYDSVSTACAELFRNGGRN
jgi:hypothetical protein